MNTLTPLKPGCKQSIFFYHNSRKVNLTLVLYTILSIDKRNVCQTVLSKLHGDVFCFCFFPLTTRLCCCTDLRKPLIFTIGTFCFLSGDFPQSQHSVVEKAEISASKPSNAPSVPPQQDLPLSTSKEGVLCQFIGFAYTNDISSLFTVINCNQLNVM